MSNLQGMFSALRISSSGMRAQRVLQNVITSNLANAETTRTSEGGPYKKQFVIFEAEGVKPSVTLKKEQGITGAITHRNHRSIPHEYTVLKKLPGGSGVKVAEIRKDSREPKMVHNPSHPDANSEGYVAMPNISVVEEMANMISATRAYEANVTAFQSSKAMLLEALQL